VSQHAYGKESNCRLGRRWRELVQDESKVNGITPSKKLLGLLEGLKRTPVGAVIYDQVARIVDEQQDVQSKVDHAYASLLHLLLNAYARDPGPDHITRINARLIQLRRGNLTPRTQRKTPDDALDEKLHRAADAHISGNLAPDVPNAQPATDSRATDIAGTDSGQTGSKQTERRVDTAYRQHLEQQRNEIEKLQDALSKTVSDAITQNREFGALLQTELRALQQATGDREIEQLQEILVGGLEELIQGQNSLNVKLHKTDSYLRLIKADSSRLQDELNKVRLLSLTDEFTGLPNRRAFMRRLQDEISRSHRYGVSLALAMMDLDEFKAINDLHGHATGDAVLKCFASEALTVLRHHDLVARYGGEEFAVLLPNTTQEGAAAAIQKVRNRALQVACDFQGTEFRLPTFSTGIALYAAGESHIDLIDRADRALYRAKRLGRNRIELEQGLPPTAAVVPPIRDNHNGHSA